MNTFSILSGEIPGPLSLNEIHKILSSRNESIKLILIGVFVFPTSRLASLELEEISLHTGFLPGYFVD